MGGAEMIIMHDFMPECYCGSCGCRLAKDASGYHCPFCHFAYAQRREVMP